MMVSKRVHSLACCLLLLSVAGAAQCADYMWWITSGLFAVGGGGMTLWVTNAYHTNKIRKIEINYPDQNLYRTDENLSVSDQQDFDFKKQQAGLAQSVTNVKSLHGFFEEINKRDAGVKRIRELLKKRLGGQQLTDVEQEELCSEAVQHIDSEYGSEKMKMFLQSYDQMKENEQTVKVLKPAYDQKKSEERKRLKAAALRAI